MNNPVDTNSFFHFLKFQFNGSDILYRISEPIGFDGATFNIEQNSKRYSRDLKYGNIEKLTFVDNVGAYTGIEQVINPSGDVSEYLNYGLEWLLYLYKTEGFEAKCEYILRNNNVDFSVGVLDFTDKDLTDGYTYLSCKLIQNNDVQDYKRQDDTKFNAFGTKNFKGNTITPAPTFNYLRKATPITNESIFSQEAVHILYAGDPNRVNFTRQIDESLINNTLTPFFAQPNFSYSGAVNNFKFLQAKNDLSNVVVKLDNDIIFKYRETGGSPSSIARLRYMAVVFEGTYTSLFPTYSTDSKYTKTITGQLDVDFVIPDITFTIPFIPRDSYLSLFWYLDEYDSEHIEGGLNITFNNTKTNIVATETGIDSVIKAVRYIDLIKQSSKFLNNIPVNASLFDVSGEHYKQVVFNRRMVSQKTDYFYSTVKDVLGSVEEVNCDYEIKEDEIYIGHQKDFYENVEIGVFQIIPSKDYNESFNDRFMCNSFRYGYKKYEQERTSKNTSQAIHTESEWIIPNLMVENKKEISNEFVRDSFSIQAAINLEITEPSTSTDKDDDVFIEEYTELPSGSFGTFGARLLMRIVSGNLEILNRDSNGDSGDVVINWTTLGFVAGDTFEITAGQNVGTYIVLSPLTNSNILLTSTGGTPTFSGDAFIQVKYYYNTVSFQTRTNQGFSIPTTSVLSNLNYSIKRNMLRWGSYIASCMLYRKTLLQNSYFKSNGLFQSQKTGGVLLTENADIDFDDLDTPLLTPILINMSLVASFNQVLALLDAYKINRGFIRCYDANGRILRVYIQKLSHSWSKNELKITAEQKYDTDFVTITYASGIITVNDVVYNLGGNLDWFKISNIMFQAFDKDNIPLCNPTRYDHVKINGIVYNSPEELYDNLISL